MPEKLRHRHTTTEKFETESFTLKTHQMFSVHTTPEELKNATIIDHFGFVFGENSVREITQLSRSDYSGSRPRENEKPALSLFLRFRDGLVCTVGLTVEINCVFKFLLRSAGAALVVMSSISNYIITQVILAF